MSAFALALLVGILVAFDPRVRDNVSAVLSQPGGGATTSTLVAAAGEIGSALLASARDQSIAHAPLLIFGVVAAVLVTFMLRT